MPTVSGVIKLIGNAGVTSLPITSKVYIQRWIDRDTDDFKDCVKTAKDDCDADIQKCNRLNTANARIDCESMVFSQWSMGWMRCNRNHRGVL
jgi:hypothetical protein